MLSQILKTLFKSIKYVIVSFEIYYFAIVSTFTFLWFIVLVAIRFH